MTNIKSKDTVTFQDRCIALRPILGKQVDQIWQCYLFQDEDGKVELEQQLELMVNSALNTDVQDKAPVFPPPTAEVAAGEIALGDVEYNHKPYCPFGLRKNELMKHVGLFGQTGTGKTNAAHLLASHIHKLGTPIWVLEFKRGWRELRALPEFQDLLVFTVGRNDIAPISFNPLIPVEGVDPHTWIKKISRTISNAFFLGQGVLYLLEVVLAKLYEEYGIFEGKAKPEITLEDKTRSNKVEAVESTGKKEGYKITKLEVRGDVDFLKTAGLYEEIRKKTEGQYLTDTEIQALVRKSNKSLIDAGYYLASLWAPPADYTKGILILQVDKGRIGKKTFYQATASTVSTGKVATAAVKKTPFKGKYYSEEQLSRRLAGLKEGDTFDYRTFYSSVYNINALPDVTMDTDLKVRKVQTNGVTERLVDMDFTVEDRLPVHGALSVGNSGTKATGDWRPSAMVQDLNLTKHDDILTLNFGPVSPNMQDLKSFGASYYLPNNWKNGGAFTLYGGYSDLDAQDVVQGVNVRGQGWFTGAQQSYKLISTEKHLLSVAFGITYRVMEDQLILTEEGQNDWPLDKRQVTMVPLSLALSYSSGQPDFIGGRNFITSQTSGHQAGFLGASDEEEIQTLRVNAKGDYFIERLQVARIQPLSGEQKGSLGWLLFAKADGQLASGPLVPAEQKAIGGMDSVRGFPERIVQGDDGLSGTLELRTPLMSTFWGSPYKTKTERDRALNEGKTTDRLQFVTFVDAGTVKIQDSLSSIDSYTIAGAGAGFRLALTKYSQLRFDWGIPIMGKSDVETSQEKIASGGRYHLSAQVQF